jgi:hypothetical protein
MRWCTAGSAADLGRKNRLQHQNVVSPTRFDPLASNSAPALTLPSTTPLRLPHRRFGSTDRVSIPRLRFTVDRLHPLASPRPVEPLLGSRPTNLPDASDADIGVRL